MPILEIKALPQKDTVNIPHVLKKASIAIAEFYECDPRHVWSTWQELKPGFYAEGEDSQDIQPRSTHPPLVTLTCFEGSSSEKIERLLELTSKILCTELGLEENLFIRYIEAKSGEVIAGNGIVRKT